jgi:nucleotide-binding universal stress UspA family protein
MIVLRHVLVATDFEPASDAALVYGRALARNFGATLHLLHVAENQFLRPSPTDPSVIKAAYMRSLNDRLTVEDRATLNARAALEVSDETAGTIVKYARDEHIDLIVMGTHGRGALAQVLTGSVAERVVRTASCPVLTVRHPEREFVLPDTPETRGRHDSPQADSRRH